MLYNRLSDHASSIRSCLALLKDPDYSASTKRGVRKWLDSLLNEYSFTDNMVGGGYALRLSWHEKMKEQSHVI